MRLIENRSVLALGAALVLQTSFACGKTEPAMPDEGSRNTQPTAASTSRQEQALRLVLEGRSSRWVSPKESCVIPFDADNVIDCASRAPQVLSDTDFQALVRVAKQSARGTPSLACARVSREIASGDSLLVSVSTVAGVEVDGGVEARSRWVWFRKIGARDSVWVVDAVAFASGDVQPITDSARC